MKTKLIVIYSVAAGAVLTGLITGIVLHNGKSVPKGAESSVSQAVASSVTSSDNTYSSETAQSVPQTSKPVSVPSVSDADSSEPEPLDKTKPEYISDIHSTEEYNPLYNISDLYDCSYRYNAYQEHMDGYRVMWETTNEGNKLNEKYNPEAAVNFAKEHWNDNIDICAPFITRCLKAGGLTIGSDSSTSLFLQFLNSGLGFGEFLPINADRTVTLPDYAQIGDIIQVYCPYEGLMIHSLIFVGNDENGNMKICAHNPANSGAAAFHAERVCYDCLNPLHEVFYFHFFRDNDKGLPEQTASDGQRILLSEKEGWGLDQKYDRQSAVAYASRHMKDGVGKAGAKHLSACIYIGGIDVGYPIQSALFVQLLESRTGTAHTVSINNDRTVYLPDYARPGDVGFVYCPEDGMMINSFMIAGADKDGKMLTYSVDLLNDGTKAYKIDSECLGYDCGGKFSEVVLFCFDDKSNPFPLPDDDGYYDDFDEESLFGNGTDGTDPEEETSDDSSNSDSGSKPASSKPVSSSSSKPANSKPVSSSSSKPANSKPVSSSSSKPASSSSSKPVISSSSKPASSSSNPASSSVTPISSLVTPISSLVTPVSTPSGGG